jgi:hypothetical protein
LSLQVTDTQYAFIPGAVVALVTRITFLGAYASSGSSALDEGMELYANYTV